ncbi:TlpA family protein disulfide reductase [Sphingobacterium sp. InxBP1]|uniref:TlpA family protein disulfide reductase n=1 Tax=Sphingobacterium sp. InxBP1 TaxID=2870328 RepID=UPI002243F2CA|nr:TlpA disulfide reductase family protein [Sphingobacterium sp. InxBP1]MCW8313751.1 TlpA family protein disulfide reductase [Sphingobacterium sp. InxBP1]
MKKIYLAIIALCLLGLLGHAQESAIAITDSKFDNTYTERAYPIIRGKINNASEEELKQITPVFTLVRPKEPLQAKLTTEIANDGTFELQLPSKLPYQQIWFSLGEYVYSCLYANEELDLTFDLEKLKNERVYMLGEGMAFAGKDGAINRTLNAYILYNKKHLPELYKDFQKLKPEDNRYMVKLDSLFNLQRTVNSNFLKENRQVAKKIIESETEAYYNSKKISYLLFKNDELTNIKELQIPIYAITNESAEYMRYLYWYINNKKLHTKQDKLSDSVKFTKIDSLLPNTYADLVKMQVSSRDLPSQLEINKVLEKSVKSKWATLYLNEENRELTSKILKMQNLLVAKQDETRNSKIGKYLKSTSFEGNLYLNEAKSGVELLKSIKGAFPDKYIIMDLWATWCTPCLSNMPHSKKLQLQADKEKLPVVFVYLCTDGNSSEALWQNKIAELELPGEHLFVQNTQMDELLTLFNGAGYPTYAVIDPKGGIYTQSINFFRNINLDRLKNLIKD